MECDCPAFTAEPVCEALPTCSAFTSPSGLSFPKTLVGETVVLACGAGFSGTVNSTCLEDGEWGDLFTACEYLSAQVWEQEVNETTMISTMTAFTVPTLEQATVLSSADLGAITSGVLASLDLLASPNSTFAETQALTMATKTLDIISMMSSTSSGLPQGLDLVADVFFTAMNASATPGVPQFFQSSPAFAASSVKGFLVHLPATEDQVFTLDNISVTVPKGMLDGAFTIAFATADTSLMANGATTMSTMLSVNVAGHTEQLDLLEPLEMIVPVLSADVESLMGPGMEMVPGTGDKMDFCNQTSSVVRLSDAH